MYYISKQFSSDRELEAVYALLRTDKVLYTEEWLDEEVLVDFGVGGIIGIELLAVNSRVFRTLDERLGDYYRDSERLCALIDKELLPWCAGTLVDRFIVRLRGLRRRLCLFFR